MAAGKGIRFSAAMAMQSTTVTVHAAVIKTE